MSNNQKRGFVSLKVVFNSEYPEAAKQELEALLYNTLIANKKILKLDISPAFILEDDTK